jgi:hypothetical protein
MTCLAYFKAYWPTLLLRWALFSLAILVIAILCKQDPRAIWPVALLVGGLLNIAWIWVA